MGGSWLIPCMCSVFFVGKKSNHHQEIHQNDLIPSCGIILKSHVQDYKLPKAGSNSWLTNQEEPFHSSPPLLCRHFHNEMSCCSRRLPQTLHPRDTHGSLQTANCLQHTTQDWERWPNTAADLRAWPSHLICVSWLPSVTQASIVWCCYI